MVELRQTWDVKWLDGKRISFPFSMVETFENKQYLRLRPTNYSLAQLLSKNAASKNASFASSGELAKLVELLRNEAASNKFYKGGKVENEDAEEDEQIVAVEMKKVNKKSQTAERGRCHLVITLWISMLRRPWWKSWCKAKGLQGQTC